MASCGPPSRLSRVPYRLLQHEPSCRIDEGRTVTGCQSACIVAIRSVVAVTARMMRTVGHGTHACAHTHRHTKAVSRVLHLRVRCPVVSQVPSAARRWARLQRPLTLSRPASLDAYLDACLDAHLVASLPQRLHPHAITTRSTAIPLGEPQSVAASPPGDSSDGAITARSTARFGWSSRCMPSVLSARWERPVGDAADALTPPSVCGVLWRPPPSLTAPCGRPLPMELPAAEAPQLHSLGRACP